MTSSVYSKTSWLLLFLSFCLSISAQESKLKGWIYTAKEGTPIAGVRITVHETEAFTFSDSTGYFELKLLAGHYHLHFEKEAFLAEDLNLDFPRQSEVKMLMLSSRIELEEILIEDALLNQSKRRYSQDILTLSPDERTQSSQLDLGSMLAQMPGVSALSTGVGISKPVIRGFSGNRVAVIDDGIKQEGQQWGLDHGLEIDPFAVTGVELIKGPAALQYGSDALGGALRLLPEPLGKQPWSAGLQSAWHSNNNTWALSGFGDFKTAKLSVNWRLSAKKYGDFKVPAESFLYNGFILPITDNTLKNTAGEQASFQTNISWNTASYRARYRFSIYQQNQGIYSGATGIPRAFDVGIIGDTRDIDLPRQEIRHYKIFSVQNIKLGDHWLELEAGYQFNDRAEKSLPHAHGFEELDSANTLALGLKLHSAQLNLRYRLHWGPADIVIGTAQQYLHNAQTGFEYLIPNYQAYQSGLFAVAKGKLHTRLHWDGGLRWEYKQQQSPLSTTWWWNNIDSTVTRSAAVDRQFSNLAGAAGLNYSISENWLLKLHLARSFRAPNVAELSSNGVHHGTFRHEVGNPNLNPELAWQLDGSLEFQNRDFLFRLSPYYYYFENFIFLRPTAKFSLLPEAGQLYEYQQAPILQGGTELYLDWHPWPKLHWSNAAEILVNQNLNTGLALPFSPPWSNLSQLRWEEENWDIGFDWRYTAAQNRVDRNEKPTPAYHLFNLRAGWEIQQNRHALKIHLSLNNIFNTAYLQHLSRYRILNLPEQGRNIVLGISYSY